MPSHDEAAEQLSVDGLCSCEKHNWAVGPSHHEFGSPVDYCPFCMKEQIEATAVALEESLDAVMLWQVEAEKRQERIEQLEAALRDIHQYDGTSYAHARTVAHCGLSGEYEIPESAGDSGS